jgi:TPR repeat protein
MAGLVLQPYDWNLIQQSAEKGFSLAQAWMCNTTDGAEKLSWAERSAAQDDPEGPVFLGWCYEREKDTERAKACSKRAAELGDTQSQYAYGSLFRDDEPEHFFWLGKAAIDPDLSSFFCQSMQKQVSAYCTNPTLELGPVIFQIGCSLSGDVDVDVISKQKVFWEVRQLHKRRASQALKMYASWLRLTKEAMDCWTVIAKRKRVVKDVRKMINNVIWESRKQGLYLLGANGDLLGAESHGQVKKPKASRRHRKT